jgi:hypothetical protein
MSNARNEATVHNALPADAFERVRDGMQVARIGA